MRLLKEKIEKVTEYRYNIATVDTQTLADTEKKEQQLQQVAKESELALITGNTCIAAFFAGKTPKERQELRQAYAKIIHPINSRFQPTLIMRQHLLLAASDAASNNPIQPPYPPLKPFDWEIEFPEVFDRDNPGFDVIVGNPPFAGKNTAINANPTGYMDWLKEIHPSSHGNSDLVAHFFRRAFTLLRNNGRFGLIATNTIAQGDTRSTGLKYICNNGGQIYQAQKRLKWTGLAAVVVSVVYVIKNSKLQIECILDGKVVSQITASRFHAGGNEDPYPLIANQNKSFQGSIVLGMWLTFDDSNSKANPLAEMQRLIEKDSRNAERIFPYMGGEEVNSSPTHAYNRYVINFGKMTEEDARQYPDLMKIVEEKVKPERLKQKDKIGKKNAGNF